MRGLDLSRFLSKFLFSNFILISWLLNRMDEETTDAYEEFCNQVAGHKLTPGARNVGMVKYRDGCVLKPLLKPALATREVAFYKKVWNSDDSLFGSLKEYIPEYKGLLKLNIDGEDVHFLKLQDVSAGLKKPCIADIKIGAQTWEPGVTIEKQIAEDMKYSATKQAYGLSITGYQVHDIETGNFIKRDPSYGKTLNKETIKNAMCEFLNYNSGLSSILVKFILNRLTDMLAWWHRQRVLGMYASSILILYDAYELDSMRSISDPSVISHFQVPWIRVYMIDFAHVIYPFNETKDINYIHGLTKLMDLLFKL